MAYLLNAAGVFVFLLVGGLLLFPLSADPLRAVPADRLKLWPLTRGEYRLLRALAPWLANPTGQGCGVLLDRSCTDPAPGSAGGAQRGACVERHWTHSLGGDAAAVGTLALFGWRADSHQRDIAIGGNFDGGCGHRIRRTVRDRIGCGGLRSVSIHGGEIF